MTHDEDKLNVLRKLSTEQDNWVATLVLDLLDTDYPDTPDGFKLAIHDGMEKCASLVAFSKQSVNQLNVPITDLSPYTPYAPYNNSRLSRLLEQAGVVGQVWPGETFGIPNHPSPLATMAVLGLLGAASGRLAGSAAETVTGKDLGPLKKRLAIYGGLAGMLPGAFTASVNIAAGEDPFFGQAMAVPSQFKLSSMFSYSPTSVIPVEKVHEMVWNDPRVASRLPVSLAAATSAITEGASRIGNRQSEVPFITPADVGRFAIGMGSGYASGWLAGKVLGALFGVSDQTQEILRRSGAAAGLIRAVVPPVFGG